MTRKVVEDGEEYTIWRERHPVTGALTRWFHWATPYGSGTAHSLRAAEQDARATLAPVPSTPTTERVPLREALDRRLPNGDTIWCVRRNHYNDPEGTRSWVKAGDTLGAIHADDDGMVEVLVDEHRSNR